MEVVAVTLEGRGSPSDSKSDIVPDEIQTQTRYRLCGRKVRGDGMGERESE